MLHRLQLSVCFTLDRTYSLLSTSSDRAESLKRNSWLQSSSNGPWSSGAEILPHPGRLHGLWRGQSSARLHQSGPRHRDLADHLHMELSGQVRARQLGPVWLRGISHGRLRSLCYNRADHNTAQLGNCASGIRTGKSFSVSTEQGIQLTRSYLNQAAVTTT